MNWDKAIDLLENGEARLVVTQAVILTSGGRTWLSFDGEEWEETESGVVKKNIST